MKDWLVKIAAQQPTDEEQLQAALDDLPVEELQKLALDAEVTETPTEGLDEMEANLQAADQMGRELAHAHGDELEKQAFLPLLLEAAGALGGRAIAGQAVKSGLKSIAGGVAKNLATNAATSAVQKGISSARQGFQPAAQAAGGFKYAGLAQSLAQGVGKLSGGKGAGFLQSAAGYMAKHPTRALAAGGAALGAARGLMKDPGFDQYGNRQSRIGQAVKGGLVGGGLGAAAGHFIPGAGKAVQEFGGHLGNSVGHPLDSVMSRMPAQQAAGGRGVILPEHPAVQEKPGFLGRLMGKKAPQAQAVPAGVDTAAGTSFEGPQMKLAFLGVKKVSKDEFEQRFMHKMSPEEKADFWKKYPLKEEKEKLASALLRGLSKLGYEISETAREDMPKSTFAQPNKEEEGHKGKYPIPDRQHARSALGFAKMHHDSAALAAVEKKVHQKFPDMDVGGK